MLLAEAAAESLAWWQMREVMLAALATAGLVAGIVNSLAGGGSFLTLPLLQVMGLGPGLASGTIRMGILAQNLSIVATFWRRGVKVPWRDFALVLPMCVGAAGGSWLATQIDDEVLRPIFGGVFVLWAIILVVKPGQFSAEHTEPRAPGTAAVVASLAIGVYGGFMQAGVGFPLLALLVGHLHHNPVQANAIKSAFVFTYTIIALAIFASEGKVAWVEAIVLACGTTTGGWLGTRLQLKHGAGLVRWFVMVMVAVSGTVMIYRAL